MHIFDVLQGKLTEKVERFGHDRLTIFGMGADIGEQQWRSVLRQLVARGMVRVDHDNFNVLRLSADWRKFVTSEDSLPLRVITKTTRATRDRKVEDVEPIVLDSEGEELFERLREWRREQADERGVPAYVIFHNATLREIAAARPSSVVELEGIKGIGTAKLDNYGEALVSIATA